jgi:DNA-directed RNA polymerase sigma subunit (sigma70/sigma32)
LLRAVETYDYRDGIGFAEHASAWIGRALERAVRDAPRAA